MPRKKNAVRADGRIAVQVYLGMVNGRRKYKTVYGKTQKEADAKALEIKLSMKKGIDIAADRTTFGYWCTRWLKNKESSVSATRYRSYKANADKFKLFESMPITKITVEDIRDIISELAVENPNTKKPMAKQTLNNVIGVARQIFDMAIENRVMDFNPAQYVKIPKTDAVKLKRRALTSEEQSWICDTPHRAQCAAMIMMYSGLRLGELIPLRWDDIDLKQGVIDVNKSVEFVGNAPIEKSSAKTASSIRQVHIPQKLVDYLKKQAHTSNLVCPGLSGGMMTQTQWKRVWSSYLTDLNFKYGTRTDTTGKLASSKHNPHGLHEDIPHFTAHWLRHTFASMLYLAGVDVLTAKDQLGHADIKTTLNIYTHLDQEHKEKSVQKLDEYLDAERDTR